MMIMAASGEILAGRQMMRRESVCLVVVLEPGVAVALAVMVSACGAPATVLTRRPATPARRRCLRRWSPVGCGLMGLPRRRSWKPFGDAGSACPMPVTFALPQGWSPTEITRAEATDEVGRAVYVQGEFRQVCQIDGPRDGKLDQLVVWVADSPLPATEATLRGFLDAAPGGDPSTPRRVGIRFATGSSVSARLGGFDLAEHDAIVPAYRLVTETVRPAG